MRKLKIFLSKHPRLRLFQRNVRKALRTTPPIGVFFSRWEKNMLRRTARERYDAEDPSDVHDYFQSYAGWIIPRVRPGFALDLGCGYGFLTKRIADIPHVRHILAIDKIPPEEFRFLGHPKITYEDRDITALRELSPGFHTIISTEFIEHIPPRALPRLFRLAAMSLADEGVFLGSTPDGRIASCSPFHVKEYSPEELESMLGKYFRNARVERLNTGCLVWEASKD